ncbi:hypothetical protein CCR75_006324 [Bremia lactucae]|uniref:Uncharacterized protein n=1 Tax=Bremia lactucae TaxID=4779 RepID=A0A976FR06_BRELC|nr:hypothetical protein CCR75_006324 [Bremia lactucae]
MFQRFSLRLAGVFLLIGCGSTLEAIDTNSDTFGTRHSTDMNQPSAAISSNTRSLRLLKANAMGLNGLEGISHSILPNKNFFQNFNLEKLGLQRSALIKRNAVDNALKYRGGRIRPGLEKNGFPNSVRTKRYSENNGYRNSVRTRVN